SARFAHRSFRFMTRTVSQMETVANSAPAMIHIVAFIPDLLKRSGVCPWSFTPGFYPQTGDCGKANLRCDFRTTGQNGVDLRAAPWQAVDLPDVRVGGAGRDRDKP